MSSHMRLAAVALALLASAGCEDILDVTPPDQLPSDEAIVDVNTARAALAGAYNALQSTAYYGGTMLFFNDLGADNAVHTGTLQTYADVDLQTVMATNTSIAGIWSVIYEGINRTNIILEQVPAIEGIDADERDQILGEAYMLRGLHHHNLVRHWGEVPIMTATVNSVEEASQVTRAPVADVYAQILADLEQAESLMSDDDQTTRGSVGAAEALQARVHLYLGNWAQAEAKADEVLARGYTLADDFSDLFEPDGAPTPEDVFRVIFTPQDYNNVGYYYLGNEFGGRGELALEADIIAAFEPGDERAAWSLGGTDEEDSATKYSTTAGAEDVHVIRLAEVILIRAEALARQGELEEAVDAYNEVRERAGLAPHVFGVDVTTQQEVLDAIWQERWVELAFEGDRFSDLVRQGRAVDVLGIPQFRTLWPIPQSERDVAPNLTQNDGY